MENIVEKTLMTIVDKNAETWASRFFKSGGEIDLSKEFDPVHSYYMGTGLYQTDLTNLLTSFDTKVPNPRKLRPELFVLNNAIKVYNQLVETSGHHVHDRMWWIFGIAKSDQRFTKIAKEEGKKGRGKVVYDPDKCLPVVEQMLDRLVERAMKEIPIQK